MATFPPLKGLHPGALTNSYCPGTFSGETCQRSCTDHEQICANEAGFWLLAFSSSSSQRSGLRGTAQEPLPRDVNGSQQAGGK